MQEKLFLGTIAIAVTVCAFAFSATSMLAGSAPPLPRPDHSANVPLTSLPTEYNRLPTVSIIVPNQINDMHHGNDPEGIQAGDRWLREHLDAFVDLPATLSTDRQSKIQ